MGAKIVVERGEKKTSPHVLAFEIEQGPSPNSKRLVNKAILTTNL